MTDPVTTPFDDICIAQQHYDRTENVKTLPATSQKQEARGYSAWAAHEPRFYPAWRAPNPESCTKKIPSPACGGRGSHEKNARIFFMGAREGGRRPEGGNTKPGFIPLGALPFPQTQSLPRLAACYEPSVYPAWHAPNPKSCMEKIPSPA